LLKGQKLLGRFELCLNVADLAKSVDFYQRLGLSVMLDKRDAGFALLGANKPHPFRLALFQGHITANCFNFRGADVFAVAGRLKSAGLALRSGPEIEADGSAGAWLEDPEGNDIYLNTSPGENADY
jgi:catechol 2,3-dioxygenase-like lactoylglutathione lyase family enzyme